MGMLVDQPSAAPTRKVAAGGIGGAVAFIMVVILQMSFGVEFPAGFEAAIATIISFAASYMTKEAA